MAAQEDLLEKGFQLACFIFPSRTVALLILSGALNKLKAQRGRENRRVYWRDKYLKRGITRISREEGDALQWLILFESDGFEKEQEGAGGQTPEGMAIRYIKNLVRMTTAMSSFYVNVGVHRLLHNYSTAETQRVYETLTERYLGADEYRRAKGALMGKLERRFAAFLKTIRTQHGELRFEAFHDQTRWAGIVEASLTAFIPWSTTRNCPVPSNFSSESSKLPLQLTSATPGKANHDQIEINRCHALIDPVCYARLTRALDFDSPEKRLALPRFFMENTRNDSNPGQSPQTPPLSAEERKTVGNHLSTEAARRRQAAAQLIRVVVDGAECAELDLSGKIEQTFEIQEGAELVEIRTPYEGSDILLATHRVAYTEAQGIAPSYATVFLKGGRKLFLDISPVPRLAEEPCRAIVRLSHQPPELGVWRRDHPSLWAGIKYATAAAALVAVGWALGAKTNADHRATPQDNRSANFVAVQPPQASPQQPTAGKPAEVFLSYRLVPDDSMVRSAGGSDVPTVMLPSRPALVCLDLPLGASDAKKSLHATLRPFLNKTDILSESLPKAKSGVGGMATFWVPSTVLESNQDYSVELSSRNPSGGLEELTSYTFRTEAASPSPVAAPPSPSR